MESISKTRFKNHALEYFRRIEKTGEGIVITDHGQPVLKVLPFESSSPRKALEALRGTVLRYDDPTEPVGLEDWDLLH